MDMTSPLQFIAAGLFGLAVVHALSTKFIARLADRHPAHAGFWHWMAEVEVVFGLWAMVLVLCMAALQGSATAIEYLESCQFTEPLFVFVIMVMAATRPVLQLAEQGVRWLAHWIPSSRPVAVYFTLLCVLPLLGSFITEPAAMTLAALMLRDGVMRHRISGRLKYGTLGVLFVNVSIGGTLTPFAAPPVLMVAQVWQWDMAFMLTTFGAKAALAVLVNALGATLLFRRELSTLEDAQSAPVARSDSGEVDATGAVSVPNAAGPRVVTLIHLVFLALVVVFAHHPVVFLGLFLFFMGFTVAYARYQSPLILREALLVAFFLAGLVVLGRMQAWWLQPLLQDMSSTTVFVGATLLTAITDNAALTYLGSLLQSPSLDFKVALVAGAVAGGGLTLIANAPNPAGAAILKDCFEDSVISPLPLLLAALAPTLVAILAFRFV